MLDLLTFLGAVALAFFWGGHVEKKHYRSLEEREARLPNIPVIAFHRETFNHPVARVEMISGSVVVGADYFKTVLSGLVSFFGGNISVLESVLERARREAVLRAKEKALGADFIANLRYETTEVTQNSKRSAPKVEAYVFATAIYLAPTHALSSPQN